MPRIYTQLERTMTSNQQNNRQVTSYYMRRGVDCLAAVVLVATVLFGLAGCEEKSDSSDQQESAEFPDEAEVEQRLEDKKKEADKEAQESITSKNAEEVASELEEAIKSEFEEE